MSGDPAQDYLGSGIAEDIITILSSYPTLRVVSRTSSFVYDKPVKVQQVGQDLNVNYVIEGSVRKAGGKVRVTAQLIDAVTGDHVWADRYDEEGERCRGHAGRSGQQDLQHHCRAEGRNQEEGGSGSLEQVCAQPGGIRLLSARPSLFFRFTKEDNAKARQIWQEGLAKFPDSALLRTKIAFTYIRDIYNECTDDPWRDAELGWKLAKEAEAIEDKSRLESLLSHWCMAAFYYFHEGDFERSADEAEAAAKMVPNDSFTRADLACYLVSAGRTERAIEWLEESIRRDAKPMDWYFGNLAVAYYFDGRPADAVTQFLKMKQPWTAQSGRRLCSRRQAGRSARHRREVSQGLPATHQGRSGLADLEEPAIHESLLKPYLADLAKAGLPEK